LPGGGERAVVLRHPQVGREGTEASRTPSPRPLIHPTWGKVDSRKSISKILHSPAPIPPESPAPGTPHSPPVPFVAAFVVEDGVVGACGLPFFLHAPSCGYGGGEDLGHPGPRNLLRVGSRTGMIPADPTPYSPNVLEKRNSAKYLVAISPTQAGP
jgi:hypothetical protein